MEYKLDRDTENRDPSSNEKIIEPSLKDNCGRNKNHRFTKQLSFKSSPYQLELKEVCIQFILNILPQI